MSERQEGIGLQGVSSVNFHLWKPCNMQCGFCFAPFEDVTARLPKGHLLENDAIAVVERLSQSGLFCKINFAGGEPTLCLWLPKLVQIAKAYGLTTSIVTNGSRLTPELLDRMEGCLDWVTLSIDSVDPQTLRQIGRTVRNQPMSAEQYEALADMVRQRNIRLKVNTVVNRHNVHEHFVPFIQRVKPERWKLLQALRVSGQNDGEFERYAVTREEFSGYLERNRDAERDGIVLVPEDNELMTGSYVMVDPGGCFFDNTEGRHTYSSPILEAGVEAALAQVSVDVERFERRGGRYE